MCRTVLNEPPFHVVESGYGGFLLPVDIYLRTTCEPRRLRFLYDLELDSSCSVACVRYEKLVFWNPTEPLRSALTRSRAVRKHANFNRLLWPPDGIGQAIILSSCGSQPSQTGCLPYFYTHLVGRVQLASD